MQWLRFSLGELSNYVRRLAQTPLQMDHSKCEIYQRIFDAAFGIVGFFAVNTDTDTDAKPIPKAV